MTSVLYLVGTPVVPPSTRTVVIPGAAAGGPTVLEESLVDLLIEVEGRGLHIALHALALTDLETPVAAVCRWVYTSDREIAAAARARYGREQTLLGKGDTATEVANELRRLPVPASRTLRRRLYRTIVKRGGIR